MNQEEYTETFISPKPVGFVVATAKDKSYFRVERGNCFVESVTNKLKTEFGHTIGQMNRMSLHEKLDEWIDGNLT